MKHFSPRLLSLFLAALTAFTLLSELRAQAPPTFNWTGEWNLTQVDGSPIVEDTEAWIEFTPQPGGFRGRVYVDNGTGPREIVSEELEMVEVEPGYWVWTNVRGNSGHVTYNPATEQFESTVDTGPNTGTVRALNPRPGPN